MGVVFGCFSFLIGNIGNFNTAYKAEVLMLYVRKIKVRFACNKKVGRFSSPYSLSECKGKFIFVNGKKMYFVDYKQTLASDLASTWF